MSARRIGTVVVGAGAAGLAASAALTRAGHDHVVLERERIGESWRTQRWDSFRLNSPRWMNGMDGAGGEFATAADLVEELRRRASGLPVVEHAGVRSVWRERGGGYVVATDDDVLRCDNVVAASGGQRVPLLPAISYRVSGYGIEHLHSGEYRRASDLPDGAVLVVGGGQSGLQIADDLRASGRRVLLSTSRVGRLPRSHRGRDVTQWWRAMGHLDQPSDEVGEDARRAAHWVVAPGRDLRLHELAAGGVELLGRLVAAEGARLRFTPDAAEHVAYANETEAQMRERIDGWIALHGVDAPPHRPEPAARPAASVVPRPTVDLRAEGVGTVIWATGFGGDFGWLRMPILTPEGLPIHRGPVTPSAGLYVLGLPWLTSRGSGILYGMPGDAELVAARIARSERRATG